MDVLITIVVWVVFAFLVLAVGVIAIYLLALILVCITVPPLGFIALKFELSWAKLFTCEVNDFLGDSPEGLNASEDLEKFDAWHRTLNAMLAFVVWFSYSKFQGLSSFDLIKVTYPISELEKLPARDRWVAVSRSEFQSMDVSRASVRIGGEEEILQLLVSRFLDDVEQDVRDWHSLLRESGSRWCSLSLTINSVSNAGDFLSWLAEVAPRWNDIVEGSPIRFRFKRYSVSAPENWRGTTREALAGFWLKSSSGRLFMAGDLDEALTVFQTLHSRHPILHSPICLEPPPAHGRLKDAVNGRKVTADIESLYQQGLGIYKKFGDGNSVLLSEVYWWISTAGATIYEYLTPRVGDQELSRPLAELGNGVVYASERPYLDLYVFACFQIAITYIRELKDRMPDYLEASGQSSREPNVSMIVYGGNVVNPQVAARIDIVNSTISGVLTSQGSTEVAEALKAIGEAVIADPDLADDDRQELLDGLQYVGEAAQQPPDNRNRGVLRAILQNLTSVATTGVVLGEAMNTWGGVLSSLVP